MIKSIRNLLLVLLIIVVLFVMRSIARVVLPLVIAIMFVLVYEPLFSFLHRKKIPVMLITPILAVGTIFILAFIIQIFVDSAQSIYFDRVMLGELLQEKILSIFNYFDEVIPIKLDKSLLESQIATILSKDNLQSFAGSSFSKLSSFGSSFFMFSLYFLILLFSMPGYNKYIKYIAGDDKAFLLNSKHIQKSIVSYMTVKFFVSLTTGTIALVVCLLFDVNYAVFWGFVTFLLNFIPTIGSIIATALPTLMAFVQFDSGVKLLFLIIILFGIQLSIGQFIEPKIMGNRLQLNTVTIIFGLVFWSFIWGIAGAFLSVPLLVILKIVLQNNESFVFVSRIMGKPSR
ncbi:AI-2E family transporter [Thiospirochaeta perfilievii]|uniref:AI-2E family transporter n=1 Tax=Thiospirochaeta perfilievii TaxID=252967 RepID=A0A5C1Q9G2_9SPIO|nr:AI-2E family transporter [Thiospirochaeta perfilievii]QEN04107.1 AI-2E family transporter [Thiospirochaeta perfilievii]